MKREPMAKDEERVCIMLNREQKKMLVQIADQYDHKDELSESENIEVIGDLSPIKGEMSWDITQTTE